MCVQIADNDKGKGVATSFDQSRSPATGMRYTQRTVDELIAVLFDSRRQSCHGLVLNRFIAFSGFKELLKAFQTACQTLFAIINDADAQPTTDSAEAKAAGIALTLHCTWLQCLHTLLAWHTAYAIPEVS